MLKQKLESLRLSRSESGFTLIEILIVIIIIAILAAIAIPIYSNAQKAAIDASVQSDVRNTAGVVSDALGKNPTATGFVVLQKGDTAAAIVIVHSGLVSVPAGEVAVPVVSSGSNQITVTGDYSAYKVCGYNTDGYNYSFSSTTGEFAKDPLCIPSEASGGTTGGGTDGTSTVGNQTATIYFGQGSLSSYPNIVASGLVTCSSGYSPTSLTPQYSTDGTTWKDFAGASFSSTSGGNFQTSGYFSNDGSDPADGTIHLQLEGTCKKGSASVISTAPLDSVTLNSSNFATEATFTGSQDPDGISIHADAMPTCQSGFTLSTDWALTAEQTSESGTGTSSGFQFSSDGSFSDTFADITSQFGDATTTYQSFGMTGDNRCTATVNSATTRSVNYISTQTVNDIVGG
jgi:type IV pilus assembly protein PilA